MLFAQVPRTDTYRTGEEMEFDPRGEGGTILSPLFEHVRDNHDDTNLIGCFSDMENYGGWGDEPSCPGLFAMTGYPEHVKHHLANTDEIVFSTLVRIWLESLLLWLESPSTLVPTNQT